MGLTVYFIYNNSKKSEAVLKHDSVFIKEDSIYSLIFSIV